MPFPRINKLNIAQIFFFFFIFSLFFPIRFVFPTKSAYLIGVYSDFTSFSLYLSDIFLIITWFFCFLPRGIGQFWLRIFAEGGSASGGKDKGLRIFLIWLILGLIWHLQDKFSLNLWYSLKYAEFLVSYATFVYLFEKISIKCTFLKLFAFFSSFEAILALWQFKAQKSLGLYKLGEGHLSRAITGVAKIVSSGTTYIRGYGTFPHPNILSAFLVIGTIICLYLLLKSTKLWQKTLYSLAILVNILGLAVSFSRAGYLALIVGLIVFFGYLLYQNPVTNKKSIWMAIGVTVVSIIIAIFIFKPFLLTRSNITDDSSLQRIFYAKIAVKMMASHPIFGLGIGESVLHMQQYSPIKLWFYQIQPIHNYFLLAGAELGIPGMLILIWIFLSHLRGLWLRIKDPPRLAIGETGKGLRMEKTYLLMLFSVLISFFLLMQFDHYFYTLQQTQLLLWLFLALIAAETKNPREGD